jgi:hypothetical protein
MSDATGKNGIAVNETERLIASDKVEGTAVYNRQGESIGSVYTLMIDKYSGQVAYAVMRREQLERAPSYASDEAPWDNPGYGRSVYDYYGMTYPYAGI